MTFITKNKLDALCTDCYLALTPLPVPFPDELTVQGEAFS